MTEKQQQPRPAARNEIFDAQHSVHAGAPPGGGWFDNPVVDVVLPSGGLVYPEGNALSGRASVVISAMTATQENILTNRSLAKRGTLLTTLIQSALRDRGINAREMLIGDRNAIMVSLRVSGYGSEYKARVTCPACDEQSDQTFSLAELPLRRLDIAPIEKGANLFEMMLPLSKVRVRFRFLTGGDEEEVAVTQAQRKRVVSGQAADSDLVTSSLQYAIVSINGVTDRAQIVSALPKMPAFDSRALRSYIQEHEPGVQMRAPMTCPGCDHVEEVEMPLGASFFWPDAK